jgi:hypothetical protein
LTKNNFKKIKHHIEIFKNNFKYKSKNEIKKITLPTNNNKELIKNLKIKIKSSNDRNSCTNICENHKLNCHQYYFPLIFGKLNILCKRIINLNLFDSICTFSNIFKRFNCNIFVDHPVCPCIS